MYVYLIYIYPCWRWTWEQSLSRNKTPLVLYLSSCPPLNKFCLATFNKCNYSLTGLHSWNALPLRRFNLSWKPSAFIVYYFCFYHHYYLKLPPELQAELGRQSTSGLFLSLYLILSGEKMGWVAGKDLVLEWGWNFRKPAIQAHPPPVPSRAARKLSFIAVRKLLHHL